MAAYIDKIRETADGISIAGTTEGRDTATARYYIFEATDEAEAIAAMRAQVPATYNAGGKVMGLKSVSVDGWQAFDPAAPGKSIWTGAAVYAGGTAGSLGGELSWNAPVAVGQNIGIVFDLVTPAAAQTGGAVAWYVGGVYRQTTDNAGTLTPAAGDAGKALKAIYSHNDYSGNLTLAGTIGDAETLGGFVKIIGVPPSQTGGDPVTLSADLDGVTPAAAQTGGAYLWKQNGTTISTTATATTADPGVVSLSYSHPDYNGTLEAAAGQGGGGGGGDRKKATISFSAALGTTTKLLINQSDIVRDWQFASAWEITGFNPGRDGIPQGAEVPDPAFGVRLSIYKRPAEVNISFIQRLNSLCGCVNNAPFLGFAEKTVLLSNVERARSGDTSADWWQIDLTFQVKPGKTITYQRAGGTADAPTESTGTLTTDSGWQYVNALIVPLKVSQYKETPLCVAAQVIDLQPAADFAWIEAEADGLI